MKFRASAYKLTAGNAEADSVIAYSGVLDEIVAVRLAATITFFKTFTAVGGLYEAIRIFPAGAVLTNSYPERGTQRFAYRYSLGCTSPAPFSDQAYFLLLKQMV